MAKITNFKITKLHGYKDLNIKFKDNKLILVGENGSGKTSVLRIFYYFLTCSWSELLKYSFETITLKIDDDTYTVNHIELEKFSLNIDKILRHLPPPIRRRVEQAIKNGNLDDIDYALERYLPLHRYRDIRNYLDSNLQLNLFSDNKQIKQISEKFDKLTKAITEKVDFTILYLPTYRRIEQELENIFRDTEIDEDFKDFSSRHFRQIRPSKRNHIELIQFGMNDVEDAKNNVLNDLKEFQRNELNTLTLKYLDDVVNKKYNKIDINRIKQASDNDIEDVLEHIDETLLSGSTKDKLKETIKKVKSASKNTDKDEHTKVICHYFIKLLDFQEKLKEKESKILDFCKVCNKYITDKVFTYESSLFLFSIKLKYDNEKTVQFSQLSSGEKQIVSLFSQLFLSQNENYFVIIDEPELSLSVPWQKEFLVDIQKGVHCNGLFAVTHSPFIYQNELEKYTHGLGEFNR